MIPLTDLGPQHAELRDELLAAVAEVLDKHEFILGRRVRDFESCVAELLGAEDAVGVSSGTDALLIALMAEGVGPGDEVITTPLTFVATSEVVARLGARPVFVDVDPNTLCLDPELVERAITPRTRAILPVHLFGQPADLPRLLELAKQHRLLLLEDAAQAFGAKRDGRAVGTWGHYGAFSFFPSKVLGGAGDGGLVLTSHDKAAKLRALRQHGSADRRNFGQLGGNFRLDALQAALLSIKLPHVTRWLEGRRRVAHDYRSALTSSAIPGVDLLAVQAGAEHAYNHFVVQSDRREGLGRFLEERGISSAAHYATPLHLQPCFAQPGCGVGAFPVAEQASRRLLALPMFPELTTAQIDMIVGAIDDFSRHT